MNCTFLKMEITEPDIYGSIRNSGKGRLCGVHTNPTGKVFVSP